MMHRSVVKGPIVGALQPAYLPWLGFFDQVFHADIFILYDDLDYSRKSWRNRNRIKGPQEVQWLTVPIFFHSGLKINEVQIDSSQNWRTTHWKTLQHCYGRAPFFRLYRDAFREIYQEDWKKLCNLDVHLIRRLLREFGIKTQVVLSSELDLEKSFWAEKPRDFISTRRIVHFMRRLGANRFLEGEAGRSYIRQDILDGAGITVRYQSYQPRPYPQLFGSFVPFLSAIDLLFNCGPQSLGYILNPCPFHDEPYQEAP